MKRFALMLSMLAVACSTAGNPVQKDEKLVTDREPASEWLVWERVDAGYQTHRVRQASDGYEVVEVYPELRIAVGEATWAFTEFEETVVEADCDCMMQAFNEGKAVEDGECTRETTKPFVKFEELDGGRMWSPDAVSDDSPESEFSPSYQVTGSLGSKVFVTTCVNQYACGAAHPSTICHADIVDLDTMTAVSPGEVFEPVVDPKSLSFETDEIDVDAAGVDLVEVRSDFGSDEVRLDHLYITDTCYACSDGSWSSYTTGAIVEDQPIRGNLGSAAQLPDTLVDFVSEYEHADRLGGWSRLR